VAVWLCLEPFKLL